MADKEEVDLQIELDGLKVESGSVRQHLKISAAMEREFFAKAYVWWRDARNKNDFLTQAYAANSIKFNATKNSMNWRPLLKLVSESKISKGDLSTWAKCFHHIHAEVEQNPTHYAANMVGQIDYFIESNGGKTGLAGYHSDDDDPDSDDDEEGEELWGLAYEVDLDELAPVFLKLAKQYYSSSPTLTLSSPPQAHFTEDDFGLAILRQGVGTTECIAAPKLSHLLDAVLQESYRRDFEAIPMSLRCPLEVLHVAAIPSVVARNLDRYIEYVKVQRQDGKKVKTKSRKRLIYRPSSGDFLLSLTHFRSSVCIISTPKVTLFPEATHDLVLFPIVQRSMEVRLLHQQMANLFSPTNVVRYEKSYDGGNDYTINLVAKSELTDFVTSKDITKDEMLGHIINLRHDPISFSPIPDSVSISPQSQPALGSFDPTWHCTVDAAWLRNAVTHVFDKWIVEYGEKVSREINKTMHIYLDANRLNVGYEFSEALGHTKFKDLPLPQLRASGSAMFLVRPTDFAFPLRQIVDLPIVGNLTLTASHEGIAITFATSACSHTVLIPACDDNGTRKTNWFSHYDLTRSETLSGMRNIAEADAEP